MRRSDIGHVAQLGGKIKAYNEVLVWMDKEEDLRQRLRRNIKSAHKEKELWNATHQKNTQR